MKWLKDLRTSGVTCFDRNTFIYTPWKRAVLELYFTPKNKLVLKEPSRCSDELGSFNLRPFCLFFQGCISILQGCNISWNNNPLLQWLQQKKQRRQGTFSAKREATIRAPSCLLKGRIKRVKYLLGKTNNHTSTWLREKQSYFVPEDRSSNWIKKIITYRQWGKVTYSA